jgi:hypothetical protein
MLRENAQKRFFSASKDLRRTELTGPINMQRADLLFASHKEINRPKKTLLNFQATVTLRNL